MGIKSFLAARRTTKKTTGDTPLRVSDYMTRKLVTFKANQPIEEVINAIIKHRISGGPVVNEKHELIGVISEGDCIKEISESRLLIKSILLIVSSLCVFNLNGLKL